MAKLFRSKLSGTAPPPSEERELAARIAAGNQEEFRKVVDQYLPTIFAMIMRQTGNRALAEELTQETFIKAFKNIGSFRGESRLGTWLVKIALNHTASHLSSRRFREELSSEPIDQKRHDLGYEPGIDLEQRRLQEERCRRLKAAVNSLSPKLRAVVVLCSFEGRSYDEAAAILEIPIGTVRSRLNKARLNLKCLLAGEI